MFCYIHIPFCRQKCSYCKFALTPFVREFQIHQYLAYLSDEITIFFKGLSNEIKVKSVYFGGGTPSVLSLHQISTILKLFRNYTDSTCEFTLEVNPEDVTIEWAMGVKALGINRVSLGVQSLQDQTLIKIGRGSREGIISALEILETCGFFSVNVDWILGLPFVKLGQTKMDVITLLEKFRCITHMSVYYLEKGDYPKDWKNICMTEIEQNQEYSEIRSYLLKQNWNHYEISNFCVKGYECRHNQSYWNHSPIRGFGLSAASYLPRDFFSHTSIQGISIQDQNLMILAGEMGIRFENSHTFSGYYNQQLLYKENLSSDSYFLEKGMFGLRTFSLSLSEVFLEMNPLLKESRLNTFVSEGLIEIYIDDSGTKRLRPLLKGIFIIDTLMEELL